MTQIEYPYIYKNQFQKYEKSKTSILKNSRKMDLKNNMDNQLCNITEDNKEMIVEQYKLYVEMADKISQQRTLTNSFYITINTALLAFVG